MDLSAVSHRSLFTDCYGRNAKKLNARLVCHDRPGMDETLRVYLNNTGRDIPVCGEPIFAYQYENNTLKANGILICRV